MIHDQLWVGMQREDGTGEGGRVEADAGASFGGTIAQSKKGKGHIGERECARGA